MMLLTLVKKDLSQFFRRPTVYLLAGVCTLFWSPVYMYAFGIYLTQVISTIGANSTPISFHDRVLIEFFYLVNFMLLLLSSAVSMKLIAEERKNKTFDLLMTCPMTSTQIVVAKFIAGYVVLCFLVFVSSLYPLTTTLLGEFNMSSMVAGYIGLLLLCGVYMGLGLLASSLTPSPMIAFILGLIFNLALWFVGIGSELSQNSIVKEFFEMINFELQFKAYVYGVIRFSSVIFFVSMSTLLIYISARLIESLRWR